MAKSAKELQFNKTVVQTIRKIMDDTEVECGYPDKTVKDPAKAFAYGLIIGTLSNLSREWELR